MNTATKNATALNMGFRNIFNTELPLVPVDDSPKYNLDEAVSDFMVEGYFKVDINAFTSRIITMESVSLVIGEDMLNESNIQEMFTAAQQHKVFELTKFMREMIKTEAGKQIEAAMMLKDKAA